MSEAVHCPNCGHHIADLRPAARQPETRKTGEAVAAYTERIKTWISANAISHPSATILTNELRAAYDEWEKAQNSPPPSLQTFGRAMRALGYRTERSHGQRFYVGVDIDER